MGPSIRSTGHLPRRPESGTSRPGTAWSDPQGSPPARGAVAVPGLLVGGAVRVGSGPSGLAVGPKGGRVGVGSESRRRGRGPLGNGPAGPHREFARHARFSPSAPRATFGATGHRSQANFQRNPPWVARGGSREWQRGPDRNPRERT